MKKGDDKPKIAIAGASGRFGSRIAYLTSAVYDVVLLQHRSPVSGRAKAIISGFDITKEAATRKIIEKLASMGVRTIVNCTGDVSVDAAEETRGSQEGEMYKVNVVGPANLAKSCRDNGVKLIHLSTEYVFDGRKPIGEKYSEEDKANTNINDAPTWYGITKAMGERQVLDTFPQGAVIIRFSQLQSPAGGLFLKTLTNLQRKLKFTRASNQMISPITDVTAVAALHQIETAMHNRNFCGIIHVSALDTHTPYHTCLMLAKAYGLFMRTKQLIKPLTLQQIVTSGEQKVLRPLNSVLDTRKFRQEFGNHLIHSVEEEIQRFYTLYPKAGK
ncbi:MAG: SDR family oxidoreductase [Patescibacteria group bacterium]